MSEQFWKLKLMAFLHDPPCKCFDIAAHEKVAESFRNEAGIEPDAYAVFKKTCDHHASAADRFPFPKGKCTSQFTGGEDYPFKHPFCNERLTYHIPMQTAELAEEKFQKTAGGIPRDLDWKSKFFLYWRRWPEESAKQDERLAYLPADTRIPDHTIWNHMSLTSAFQSCVNVQGNLEPAFLHFQLGPVQEFIAAAKSTRDLAAGSYLLAWLTAHAMKAVSEEIGPDCIVFPSLRGQPIFDLLHKPLFEQVKLVGKDGQTETLWSRMYGDKDVARLLRPTLPNRFCALVPAWRGEELAHAAEQAVHAALEQAGNAVWPQVAGGFIIRDSVEWKPFEPTDIDRARWDKQIEMFPQITWTVSTWLERAHEAETIQPWKSLADKVHPEDRDTRNYPLNPGFFWQAHLEAANRDIAARRNLRDFSQPVGFNERAGSKKDRLSGRDEEIGSTGYSAMTILKRMFHEHVLRPTIGANKQAFWDAAGYDDTRTVAEANPLTLAEKKRGLKKSANPYIAVLALDGDEMGKWMSGEKARPFLENLAGKAPSYFKGLGVEDSLLRALSPAYHLQFSEALSNVALQIADRVVSDYDGQLIYAGGDDVLAMLPAMNAIHCAQALRLCFRGEALPENVRKRVQTLHSKGNGFISAGQDYPLLVPGLEADVSCGIAIGHCNHPLQALVREAQNAEKRAKNDYGRSAFALSLIKRSGEMIHWGAKWESAAIALYDRFEAWSEDDGPLSGRFPYALAELLKPYRLGSKTKPERSFKEVIWTEFLHVLGRQSAGKLKEEDTPLAKVYLTECVVAGKWEDFSNLFLAATFINRPRGEE